jgi:hypothetical protein
METALHNYVSDFKNVPAPTMFQRYSEEFNIKGIVFHNGKLMGVYYEDFTLIPVNLPVPMDVVKAIFKAKTKVKGFIEVIQGIREAKVQVFLIEVKSRKRWRIYDSGWVEVEEGQDDVT